MIITLSEEQREAIGKQHGEPLHVEDPLTHARYVVIELAAFERLKNLGELDLSEPNPRDFYPAFADAVQQHIDAEGLGDANGNFQAETEE
jgi:hypothetical protein